MSRQASKTKVGAFVLVGLIMAVGSIIWLGATKYFEGGRNYVTFFKESVQGLQRDSVVKYRGVDIGRVTDIRVAPDYKLIEVVMHIQFHGEPEREMEAQLRSVGITGIVFVELDLKKPGDLDQSPRITFAAEYPIIPSKPSEISQIMSVIEKVAQEFKKIDFNAMADKINTVLQAAQDLVTDKRLSRSLTHLEKGTVHLQRLLTRADKMLAQADLEGIVTSTNEVLQAALSAIGEIKAQVKEMNLPATAKKVDRLLDNADQRVAEVGERSRELMEGLLDTGRQLNQASRSLEGLLERLEQSPSDVLFSEPPRPDRREMQ